MMEGRDEMIRFSVVIPVYNAADTVVGTIQSVLDQGFPAFEVIVVNDCSTDNTEELLMQHFRKKIIYVALPENAGPSHARNVGVDKATGSHIAFQDADDLWHKDKLKMMEETLRQHPAIRFLFHDYTTAALPAAVSAHGIVPVKVPFSKLLIRNIIATPCTVFSRSDMPRFDEQMHHTEDYDLFLRTAYKTGAYHLPLVLTTLDRPVLSEGGQSSNRWKMRKGELKAYLHLARLHPLFGLIIPFLLGWAMIKHLWKMMKP